MSTDIGSLIYFPETRYGRPCLAGTGMYVYRVVDYHRMGMSPEEMQAGLDHIPLSHFYAALAYYYANQEACDQFMRERDEEAERLYQEHVASRKVEAGRA
jgi:uncharacterized protein (DUF433 family)